ncbi:MAG: hypothetical protein ABW120_10415 [Sedimenticola sp.]
MECGHEVYREVAVANIRVTLLEGHAGTRDDRLAKYYLNEIINLGH